MGIAITGSTGPGNVVVGNMIGTDITGTLAVSNGTGVLLTLGTFGNTIGGTSPGSRNLISGNSNYGINITDGSNDNVVEGNEVGTDRDGTTALPNNAGIALGVPFLFVDSPTASGNTIGGTATARET